MFDYELPEEKITSESKPVADQPPFVSPMKPLPPEIAAFLKNLAAKEGEEITVGDFLDMLEFGPLIVNVIGVDLSIPLSQLSDIEPPRKSVLVGAFKQALDLMPENKLAQLLYMMAQTYEP